ncbi:MAG: peptidyl-prolyl cis-trans isomerase [Abditibacteriales bacterium]|nr:peptidyl-prolyl cis-trans isomerase [Abditibacteriales bacterium]MDW8367455.1 peptidyl-prolyl cis-trans isomerase [Abditibacteriales bacterium]
MNRSSFSILFLAAVCLGGGGALALTGCGKGPIVADVNGTTITESEFIKALKRSPAGQQVLVKLIQDQLVLDELKKNGLTVSEAEVNRAYKQAWQSLGERYGVKTEAEFIRMLQAQGSSKEMLLEDIRIGAAKEKLLTKHVKYTPEDIKRYFERHRREQFDTPERVSLNFIVTKTKDAADQALKSLAEGRQWDDLAREISLPGTPLAPQDLYVDALADPHVFGKEIAAAVAKLEEGAYTAPMPIPPTSRFLIGLGVAGADKPYYVIIRLVRRHKSVPADFEKVKDQVEQRYRLEQALKSELDKYNYHSQPENVKKQLLNQAVTVALQKMMDDLHKRATVIVRDPDLLAVERMFGAPASATLGLPSGSPPPASSTPSRSPEGGQGK